eukprot:Em0009g1305a
MDYQHQQVREWLEKLYGKQGVPEYEINSRTISYLHTLAKQHDANEKRAQLVIEDMEQKTAEYAEEALRLQSILDGLGCSLERMAPDVCGYVESLSSIASFLNLKDCSDMSYCLALTELSQEMADYSVRMQRVTSEVEKEQEGLGTALLKDADHTRVLSELAGKDGAPELAKRTKETMFLEQKSDQYSRTIESLQGELKMNGYDNNINHRALQLLAKEIEDLQQEIIPLKDQVTHYQQLPPDSALARLKVEEAQQQLAKLEAELSKSIDLIHVEK